jgi:hypothetical protein
MCWTYHFVIYKFPEGGTLVPKYVGVDRMILNNKLQITVREEDVFHSMLIPHYFPSESGRNSLTLSKCISMASIQN